MTLPDGIVIDLAQSGMGLGSGAGLGSVSFGHEPFNDLNRNGVYDSGDTYTDQNVDSMWNSSPHANTDPIITFTPNGSVGHVVTNQTMRASGPIFLLLGRRELMSDVAAINNGATFEDKNFRDSDTAPKNLYLQNFWITIGHQTGLVTTAEMSTNLPPGNFTAARAIAITSQSVGGR